MREDRRHAGEPWHESCAMYTCTIESAPFSFRTSKPRLKKSCVAESAETQDSFNVRQLNERFSIVHPAASRESCRGGAAAARLGRRGKIFGPLAGRAGCRRCMVITHQQLFRPFYSWLIPFMRGGWIWVDMPPPCPRRAHRQRGAGTVQLCTVLYLYPCTTACSCTAVRYGLQSYVSYLNSLYRVDHVLQHPRSAQRRSRITRDSIKQQSRIAVYHPRNCMSLASP